jgi:predicted nucleic acid-binding protein
MAPAKKESPWGGLSEGDLVVVDTSPIIYVLDGNPEFSRLFEGLFEAEEQGRLRIAISTIALAEVLTGPLRKGLDALAKRYEKALGGFQVVPVSEAIAVTAARLRANNKLKLPDAIHAATALEIGAAALVSADRDFAKLKGLKVLPAAPKR